MHEFYKYIETKYDNSSDLLFTDSDSLVYEMVWDGIYEDFYENKNLFDLVTILKIQYFVILPIKMWLVKWKMKSKGR